MEFIKEAGVSPQKSMDIKNDKITIKPLRDKDVDIFSKWLAKEYIYKWFCPDGEEHKMAWLDEVNNRNTQYHYMKHFIVYYNDRGIDKLPKNLRLSEDTQSMGDKLLQAFKASKMSEKTFNNGRLAKGLKQFFKDKNPTIEQMVVIIEAMNKDVWHVNYPKPKGSPEAKNYAENFAEYYEDILSK